MQVKIGRKFSGENTSHNFTVSILFDQRDIRHQICTVKVCSGISGTWGMHSSKLVPNFGYFSQCPCKIYGVSGDIFSLEWILNLLVCIRQYTLQPHFAPKIFSCVISKYVPLIPKNRKSDCDSTFPVGESTTPYNPGKFYMKKMHTVCGNFPQVELAPLSLPHHDFYYAECCYNVNVLYMHAVTLISRRECMTLLLALVTSCRLELVASSMTSGELQQNLSAVYECDINVQLWLERKWLPHKHVCALHIRNSVSNKCK